MSNYECPYCGMTNIDCGSVGYKTPREIELENICQEDTHTFADGTELRYDSLNEILAIIDMAEGRSK